VKILKKVLLTLGIVFLCYFGTVVFTYPTGAANGITNPGEAITLLAKRVTQLEWRVARMEKILGLDQEKEVYQENGKIFKPLSEFAEEYPYLAKVAPELEGKVAARYRYYFGHSKFEPGPAEPGEENDFHIDVVLKNISDQKISGCGMGYSIKSIDGEVIVPQHLAGRWDLGEQEQNWVQPGEIHFSGVGRKLRPNNELVRIGIDNLKVEVIIMEVQFRD